MNKILIPLLVLLVGMLLGINFIEKDQKLVWSDEFENKGMPDKSRWTIVTGNGCPGLCGFGNNELQYYTRETDNVSVEDGVLVITARKESIQDNDYTSAKLVTAFKGDWKYGRIEVKAKLPEGRGTWPAIWMLPTLEEEMSWPEDGEIDVMEHVGYHQGWVHGTIHSGKYNHLQGTQKVDSIYVEDAHTEFHTYAIEWDRDYIKWFVDDKQYHKISRGDDGRAGWPFDQKFHLIINLAVGGNWGGKHGVAQDIWPQSLVVDYVRVYEL